MESPGIPTMVDTATQIKGANKGCKVPWQEASYPPIVGMPCRHGMLSGTVDKAIIVESSPEWAALSSTASKASIEEGEVPQRVSMLFNAIDEVSIEEYEATPFMEARL